MAKKLILLLLIIPIVVMILLFAATQSLSNLVDVPVSRIEIIEERQEIFLNIDNNETYTLEYAVYPTTAKNQKVSVSTEPLPGTNRSFAELELEKGEGNQYIITPKTTGSAKVTLTTIDGGFSASIAVFVDSTSVKSIDATVNGKDEVELYVGKMAQIRTTFQPSNPSDLRLTYKVPEEYAGIIQVSPAGVIKALREGTAKVTVVSKFNESITDTVTVVVKNENSMDLGVGEEGITNFAGKGSIPISIRSDEVYTLDNLSYEIFYASGDKKGQPVSADLVDAKFITDATSGKVVSLDYEFKGEDFFGDVEIRITFSSDSGTVTQSCPVTKTREVKVSFVDKAVKVYAAYTDKDGKINPGFCDIFFTLTPEDVAVNYQVQKSNDNIKVEMGDDGSILVFAYKAGLTTVTLTVTAVDDPTQVKTITTEVAIFPRTLEVSGAGTTIGIENRFTLGGYAIAYPGGVQANGQLIRPEAGVHTLQYATNSEIGEGFDKILSWNSDSAEVLINNQGAISFVNDTFLGDVTFKPSVSYAGFGMEEDGIEIGSYKIRCVANGVNVYTYPDLYHATATYNCPVVLRKDIKEGFGTIDGKVMYTEMDTTYDKDHYVNTGRENETKIKILIQFKQNVYGNGYVINAHEITYKIDKKFNEATGEVTDRILKDDALFKGPLDFVSAVSNDGDGQSTISVKGQDNICFAVYDNVTINNVELLGCDLESADGKKDLIDLDYVGTTVEVLGDNVRIEYSRLTHGRTVLRVFGDDEDSEKAIHLTITNSVLSGAREFIMRVGSNRFVDAADSGDNSFVPSNLPGDNGAQYNTKQTYHQLTAEQQKAYDEKFINTFVTVKNSVFKDTGIFAIGMDSHFAGPLLHNGQKYAATFGQTAVEYVKDWKNLAKTSYGAKLYFEGEVGLYNWKDVEDIDSSTLIKVEGANQLFNRMALNLQDMIKKASEIDRYSNIVTPHNGKSAVHAGIAFFGGGKNYSVFDSEKAAKDDPNAIVNQLGRYSISLSDAGRAELLAAAGNEDFYFLIYNQTSKLSPAEQDKALDTESAYDIIKKGIN